MKVMYLTLWKEDGDFYWVVLEKWDETSGLQLTIDGGICFEVFPSYSGIACFLGIFSILLMPQIALVNYLRMLAVPDGVDTNVSLILLIWNVSVVLYFWNLSICTLHSLTLYWYLGSLQNLLEIWLFLYRRMICVVLTITPNLLKRFDFLLPLALSTLSYVNLVLSSNKIPAINSAFSFKNYW